ncbi:MAG: hypothetical protein R3B40_22085 [Polyangiales bacterium]|nr:hypothetical protein [Myxococcales bacterium]MCB9656854.1 hypothetical protein [Sandaracinaceae bacterium]
MAPDSDALAAAQGAYRRGRARMAFFHALPALLYMGGALALGSDPRAAWFALATFVVGALAVFVGGSFGRAVRPALVYGALPFVVTHAVQSFGHVCVGDACMSWCLPACSVTGLVVGLAFVRRAERDKNPFGFFAAGLPIVVATGALGCRCLGYSSVAGMAVGMLLVSLPAWPRWAAARAAG